MHYVILPRTCSGLLKFYRAVLLIEAISAGDMGTALSRGGRCARQVSLPLLLPFLPLSRPLSVPPHPVSPFCSGPSLFLFQFSLGTHPPPPPDSQYPSQAEIIPALPLPSQLVQTENDYLYG